MRGRLFIVFCICGLVGMLVWAPVSVAQNRTTGSENPSLRTEPIPADDLPPGVSEGKRLVTSNLRVASILSRLDIDGDGRPDNSPDTDGDGLPDNWEVGGFEARAADGSLPDRVVYFPAPSPIVPGTPPTPIFSRLPVATSAVNPDTDGDGVSDFTEVFGLLFIDENLNGILDSTEWEDRNTDGLPSPGEWPRSNIGTITNLLHDFDGFVFTDPTNYDTDGDGKNDREDNDPLINPRAFGLTELVITRANIEGDKDLDNDGLGDGMDIGNDLVEGDGDGAVKQTYQVVDNPTSIRELLSYFRQDLLNAGYIPESQIEDLLGQDWDANGLWRTTDVRDWSIIIDTSDTAGLPPSEYFCLTGSSDSASYACDAAGERRLYATQQFETLAELWNENSGYASYGGRGIGLGWNSLLKPSGQTKFIPDFHVWAILYSWRMPGFDIDGDGFIGSPNISSTKPTMADSGIASVAVRNGILVNTVPLDSTASSDLPLDDRIKVTEHDSGTGESLDDEEPALNGRISVPDGFPAFPCGTIGMVSLMAMMLGIAVLRMRR